MLTHVGTQTIETERLILRRTYEGTFRDFFWRKDHYEGRMVFSILKEEYEAKQ